MRKMTLHELKQHMPTLIHKKDGIYHTVGYIWKNDNGSTGFMISGSGFTEQDAWQDAFHWINKSGIYKSTNELSMF